MNILCSLLMLCVFIPFSLAKSALPNPPLEQLPILNALDSSVLAKGADEMKKHKVVFAGITRNNAPDLAITIKTIEYIGSLFSDYRVIIFENDSDDGTKKILANWKMNNPRINIISENYSIQKRPSNKFLAAARNKYIKALQDKQYAEFDMAVFIDMDMAFGIDVRGIRDSFAKMDAWDAVCSNGIFKSTGEMWDAFAFRNAEFPHDTRVPGYWDQLLPKIQKVHSVGSDLTPVHSCFGGLAIYKKASIANCEYDSIDEDCEHIAFHKCATTKNKMRMFLNPNQVIRYSHYK